MGFTHSIFSLLLSLFFNINPALTIIFSLFPDLEFLLPVIHRGPLHSLVFLGPIGVLLFFKNRELFDCFFVGVFSHLFLDSFTKQGIPLFYPFLNFYFSLYFFELEWIVIVSSLVLIFNLNKVKLIKQFLPVFLFLWFFILLFSKADSTFNGLCNGIFVNLSNMPLNKEIVVNGIICSEINEYKSKSGYAYQFFNICSGNGSVKVFKSKSVLENLLKRGDFVEICGFYDKKYGLEIRNVKYIKIT